MIALKTPTVKRILSMCMEKKRAKIRDVLWLLRAIKNTLAYLYAKAILSY